MRGVGVEDPTQVRRVQDASRMTSEPLRLAGVLLCFGAGGSELSLVDPTCSACPYYCGTLDLVVEPVGAVRGGARHLFYRWV